MDCHAFSTCQSGIKKSQKLKACWDNMNQLTYDKSTGLFCKEKFGIKVCYDMGECPCGEIYLERDRLTTPLLCWFCSAE